MSLVLQRKNLIHLTIKANGHNVDGIFIILLYCIDYLVVMRKGATVKETVETVKQIADISGDGFSLYMVGDEKYGDVGLLLDDSKHIQSYKIKQGV